MHASARFARLLFGLALPGLLLAACAGGTTLKENGMTTAGWGEVQETGHRGGDDLLSAGLGLRGLAGTPSAMLDPLHPTAAELRRRAIQSSWKGIADLGPLGGYGSVYGSVPDVPGREFTAFARLPDRQAPHRVLLQVPDGFDHAHRCLVVAPSSGSRGIYGAIALAGAWGLPKGCAVAYTDKGTGAGYFDYADDSGVALDGRRARRGTAELEFEPAALPADAGIAIKHMHSGDNPEADWGRHVIQAAHFGLAMLDRAFPAEAPFTPANTKIIATGLSNGGGAVLNAAGLDQEALFAGVVALEPNVHVAGEGRALYDYATEAALWMPCALLDARFATVPFARDPHGQPWPHWQARCASLRKAGKLASGDPAAQAAEALARLHRHGWRDETIATGATTTAFDLWRVIAAGYASAYLRRDAAHMPCAFRYRAIGPNAAPQPADPRLKAAWWADGSGIPPGNGIGLFGHAGTGADATFDDATCLRALWTGDDAEAQALHAGVAATAVKLPRPTLPVWVLHGESDGLLPITLTSDPYVAWLRANGRHPIHWRVPHAQHFEAFLPLPGFGDRHAPLMPFGYTALDRLWAHLFSGGDWPLDAPAPAVQPRGPGPLTREALGG